jgi:hypothetical protein
VSESAIGPRRRPSASALGVGPRHRPSASAIGVGPLRRPSASASASASDPRSQGGHRIARFSTAAGSTAESRAALRIAVAWGYVQPRDIEAGEARLDRVAAMLHRLGARR